MANISEHNFFIDADKSWKDGLTDGRAPSSKHYTNNNKDNKSAESSNQAIIYILQTVIND